MMTSRRSSTSLAALFLASIAASSSFLNFSTAAVLAFAPEISSSSRRQGKSSIRHTAVSFLGDASSTVATKTTTSLSSSRDQAEEFLSTSYPQFYYLLQQNPIALNLMRNSKAGFAVFAPSDAAIAALGEETCNLLNAACNDPDMQPVIAKMASYHIVNAPMSSELLCKYGVASTPGGELTVQSNYNNNDDNGTTIMFDNGVSILASYEFQDELVQNVQDVNGNLMESSVVGGGKTCIVHEVDGFVCPEGLWGVLYEYFGEGSAAVY
jgi:uncharacterized surface protein with fasciclin (FAS1) repeats